MRTRVIAGIVLMIGAILLPQSATATSVPEQYAVASITTTTTTEPLPVMGTGTRCYGSTRTHLAKSWSGAWLFAYSQRVEWCAANGRIVGTPYRTRWGTVYQALYEFRGHIDSSTVNRGTSYTAFTQGSFYFCFPGGVCPQYRYPFVEQTVLPNGLTYGRNGG